MSCLSHWLVPRGSIFHNQFLLVLSPQSCRVRNFSSGTQIKQSLRESYRLLQLPPEGNGSLAQVKEAYLQLAKLYHPDSGAPTANAELFAKIEEAYRTVLAHQCKPKQAHQEKTIEEEEKRQAALAHRHYLNYEGVGFGTPFQRESQYRQIRVDRATEKVLKLPAERARESSCCRGRAGGTRYTSA